MNEHGGDERATRLLSVEEAARELHVGRTFAWELAKTGRIPTVRLGRLVRIRPADLTSYVASLAAGDGDHSAA